MRATCCGQRRRSLPYLVLLQVGFAVPPCVAAGAVRSYRTISPLPAPLARRLGGIFLLHFPWTRVPQALPGTMPCGARTFLHPVPLAQAKAAAAWPTLGAHHYASFELAAPAYRPRCRAPQRFARRGAPPVSTAAPSSKRLQRPVERPRHDRHRPARAASGAAPAMTSTISPATSASVCARSSSSASEPR